MSERVRIFGPDDQDHLDIVREGEEVRFMHYKLLPVETVGQQTIWADVAMVSMAWTQLVDAIDQLKDEHIDRPTRIQGRLPDFEPGE